MKRRHFLLSGTASAALALTGCGGGGGDSTAGNVCAAPSGSTNTSAASAPDTRIAAAASGPGYPFGSRLVPYATGTKPTQSNAAMDALLTKQYDAWKAARIVSANSVVAGGYADQFSNTAYLCVSEGMGYAMLLAVLFAGHDPQAQQLFDGLLSVVRTRYAYAMVPFDPSGKYLMDWRVNADGTSAGGGWNAMDGDLDIAMALLMADKQWGSTGTWNYLQEGKNTIGALKHFNMAPDGTTKGLAKAGVSRTSDYMIGHFRAFQAATGDSFWSTAVDRAYFLANLMQTSFSPAAGLIPDFIVNTDTGSPIPSPGYMGDGDAYENDYWWNACRNPWRYATDYLQSADSRWKTVTGRLVNFFKGKADAAGGDVTVIGSGYSLDGATVSGGSDASYMAPLMLGGCIDASYQTFVDALWNWNASHLTTGYYDSEIQLLSMVVASGNWWTPGAAGAGTQSQPQTSTAAGAAGNILVNGNFANGLANWNNWGNSQVVAGAVQVGTAAGGVAQDIASELTPGSTYQLTATANISAVAEGAWIGVKLMDRNGNVLVDQVQQVSDVTSTGVSVTFTAPQGAASGYVYVWKDASVAYAIVGNVSLTPSRAAAVLPSC
ncbi:MAG TPA: glycosyl hydrolase family 8 [Ramlibacter sp.]|nr:glycosyl hydrolase family 8 [Ramlibacter sp.]